MVEKAADLYSTGLSISQVLIEPGQTMRMYNLDCGCPHQVYVPKAQISMRIRAG